MLKSSADSEILTMNSHVQFYFMAKQYPTLEVDNLFPLLDV